MTKNEDAEQQPTMRRFSERMGAVETPLQVQSMNAPLRNSLWNYIRGFIPSDNNSGVKSLPAVAILTANVLREPVETIGGGAPRWWLHAKVQAMSWHEVYDLVEYMAKNFSLFVAAPPQTQARNQTIFRNEVNGILEREHAGYRFVGGVLTEMTSPTDIAAIEKAMTDAAHHGFGVVREHISQALVLLGKRPEPDVRNAIKEAISAVEAAANLIQGGKKRTLDPALDLLERRLKLHPAFKTAFSKLYGFTGDDSGIRHSLLEEATVDDADARFFIVACSAFVSWLMEKADRAGLLKTSKES